MNSIHNLSTGPHKKYMYVLVTIAKNSLNIAENFIQFLNTFNFKNTMYFLTIHKQCNPQSAKPVSFSVKFGRKFSKCFILTS